MDKKLIIATALTSILAVGCASPKVVSERKASDHKLTCEGIERELSRAEKAEDDARDARGVTGTNVAAAVFFWPALIVTAANTGDAIDAAEDRMDYLYELYDEAGCNGQDVSKYMK